MAGPLILEYLAKLAYDSYNAGGSDPDRINKNFRGMPCPLWEDLPDNVQEKWMDAVSVIQTEVLDAACRGELKLQPRGGWHEPFCK